MKKYNCPICKKELIRLEPYNDGVYNFWCDACNIDICITNNKEVEFSKVKGVLKQPVVYHDAEERYNTIPKIINNEILDRYFIEYNNYNKSKLSYNTIKYYKKAAYGYTEYTITADTESDKIWVRSLVRYAQNIVMPLYPDIYSFPIKNLCSGDIHDHIYRIIHHCLGHNDEQRYLKEIGKEFPDE